MFTGKQLNSRQFSRRCRYWFISDRLQKSGDNPCKVLRIQGDPPKKKGPPGGGFSGLCFFFFFQGTFFFFCFWGRFFFPGEGGGIFLFTRFEYWTVQIDEISFNMSSELSSVRIQLVKIGSTVQLFQFIGAN